jgi:hypothetical protein
MAELLRQHKGSLSDGQTLRSIHADVNQIRMFFLGNRFIPQVERLATVRDLDDALNRSRIYPSVLGDRWARAAQYAVYRQEPTEPLGATVTWVESGRRFVFDVPDIQVHFGGRLTSLRDVTSMVVFDSIGLLQIRREDGNLFIISAVNPKSLRGRVRAVDFMGHGWAGTDGRGLPLVTQATSKAGDRVRYGSAHPDFMIDATGWHGSLALGYVPGVGSRGVYANSRWFCESAVATVSLATK